MEEILTMQMPTVALRELCILPGMIIHFDLSRAKSIRAVEQAMVSGQQLFVVMQKDGSTEDPGREDLHDVGTVTKLRQMSRLPSGIIRVLVEGLERARIVEINETVENYLQIHVQSFPKAGQVMDEVHKEAMLRQLKELFQNYVAVNPKNGRLLEKKLDTVMEPAMLIDMITSNLPLPLADKQKILEAEELPLREEILSAVLSNEIQIGMIRKDLTEKIQSKVNKNQRDYILREQMSAIKEQLGEKDADSEAEQFMQALSKLDADPEIKERIEKEIGRFKTLSANSSESVVERGYIETLLELPWNKDSKDSMDFDRAKRILQEDHYGLKQVKDRVLEFLAVRSLLTGKKREKGKATGPILCLVGPPGTGKTSIAQSVARALNKEFVRISLGGVRDEAEIRGHRRTYVGAMPGRIAAGLKQAGVGNPLMLLDEIDKAGRDHRGDTAAALLEVLDGEQNYRFRDHYVELPLDLSRVLFIATANSTSEIPRPLLDRMELIEVNSYTDNEKFHIAKDHLLPKVCERNGMEKGQLSLSDGALRAVIEGYTKEAGVRNLERRLGEICRKAAIELVKKTPKERKKMRLRVTERNLEKYLGKVKYTRDMAEDLPQIGIVRGLAWTSVGGDTLQIEVTMMPGKGSIELTGQMGDVMKESAMAGLSYVRSIGKDHHIAADTFKKNDFHIHIPQGAVPKDGPSAGITMATALFSAITGRKVRADLAMTGEITLRGRVLPIGGLKEKILAAKQVGIKEVLVPEKNKKDVEEISTEIKNGIQIRYVTDMKEVLEHALLSE